MSHIVEVSLKDDIQEVFNAFSTCFKVRIGYFSANGEEMKIGLDQPLSGYCQYLQKKLGKRPKCLECDEANRKIADEKGSIHAYICHAGLCEVIAPILYKDMNIGYMFMGQMRTESANTIPIELLKGPGSRAAKEFERLPFFNDIDFAAIMNIFSYLVDYIVLKNMVKIKTNLIIDRIMSFAEQNMGRNISLSEASNLVARSPSTVSHLFKKSLNRSFKTAMIELKLKKAEALLKETNFSIADICRQVGIEDQFYFSRLFKKYKNVSPRGFRKEA